MTFIYNGKEIQPTSVKNYPNDETGMPNAGESMTFPNVKDGDDFVVIVYDSIDQNAIAFPFVVNHANIYG